MRNFILLIITIFLIACGQTEYELAFDAYDSKNYELALKKIIPLSESGDERAQNILGLMYEQALGVERNYAEAAKWYKKAAKKDVAESQIRLAQLYVQGLGVKQDYWEGMKWARKAAVQGNPEAEANIGYMFHDGIGVKKDFSEAVKWYRKAAEKGWVSAQHDLGVMYEHGRGVSRDYVAAIEWYRKAANRGYIASQSNLIYLYDNLGISQHNEKTLSWFTNAAKEKNLMAQYKLGTIYYDGEITNRDMVKAYAWVGIAAVAGYKPAESKRDEIASKLSEEEIKQAKILAKNLWNQFGREGSIVKE